MQSGQLHLEPAHDCLAFGTAGLAALAHRRDDLGRCRLRLAGREGRLRRDGASDGVWYWTLPETPNGLRPTQSWSGAGSAPGGDVYGAGMDQQTNAACTGCARTPIRQTARAGRWPMSATPAALRKPPVLGARRDSRDIPYPAHKALRRARTAEVRRGRGASLPGGSGRHPQERKDGCGQQEHPPHPASSGGGRFGPLARSGAGRRRGPVDRHGARARWTRPSHRD